MRRAGLLAAFGLLSVGGCSPSFIPESGPKLSDVLRSPEILVQNTPAPSEGYALIRVDGPVASRLAAPDEPPRFDSEEVSATRGPVAVGVGDVLQVTIFETGSGGLFIPADAGARPGNFVQLPPQQVGQDGNIVVPWAGRVRANGRTPIEIQADVERKLAQRALEPQVVVSFVERHANDVSVLGDVNTATRFSLDPSGDRVLSAIARAGGPRFASYESLVTVQRRGTAQTALLSEIAADPAQNIAIAAGDVVYVSHQPRYFLAVGATGQTTTLSQLDRRFPFGDTQLTLAEALAKAGGLQDDRANAKAVLLYRVEPRATLAALGLPVPQTLPDKVPTIYALDLTDPSSFFLANRVHLRNNDTIYVANAPITDLNKLLTLLLPFAQSASFVRVTTN